MKKVISVVLVILAVHAARAGTDTLLLGSYVGYTPPVLYWIDAGSPAESYSEAIAKFTENKFKRWNRNMAFTMGITGKAYWVLLKVKDTSATMHKYLWSFYHTSCEYEYYELNANLELLRQYKSSTFQPLGQRPYPVRSVSFPFTSTGGESKLLLVKVRSTNTDVLYLDQDIASPEDFLQWEIGYTALLNRYFGFFIFALLANVLLFIFIRNKIYGWLSAYILFMLLYNLNDFSFDALIFPDWFFRPFALIPKFTWIMGAAACSLIVFNLFAEQDRLFPGWFRISSWFINGLQLLLPVCIVLHWAVADHQSTLLVFTRFLGYLLLASTMAFQIANLLFTSFKKSRASWFFLLSSSPLILSAFIYYYYLLTSAHVIIIWPSNVIVAGCFEVILLTIIFIYDYRNKNLDRNRLLEELLLAERRTASAILNTQEQERKRIAEDLHDELGSSLAALKLQVQKTNMEKQPLEAIIRVIDKASADTRNISHNLMPPEFEHTNLENLLMNYYSKLNAESGIRFHFQVSGKPFQFIKEVKLIIYRVLMELTGNILKHSHAAEATIQLIYYPGYLEIMTEDNGRGMRLQPGDGIGLKNIQSRVNYLGGTIKIDSGQGGTTIIIQIPFKSKGIGY